MADIMMKAFSCMRDERTIRGHVFCTDEKAQKAVIVSHGFLATEKTVWDYARLLAGLGYKAYTFDFCGGGIGGKSDGNSSEMTVLTEREDLLCVASRVLESSSELNLMGCSQGGFVSALAARRLGDIVRRLVMFYPALCIPDDARKGRMMMYRFDPNRIPDILGRFPMKLGGCYARSVLDMDVMEEIGGFPGKTLIVHGTDDRIVSVEYSRKAKTVFPDCVYHEIAGGGHGFVGKAEKDACSILAAFMQDGN